MPAVSPLAWLVLLAQAGEPLFSNDPAGVVRALGLIGGALIVALGASLTFIYKILHGPAQRALEDVKDDLDGVGQKVSGLETRESGAMERLRAQEHASATLREELNRMHQDYGELKAEVRRGIDESHEMRVDIIGAIGDSKRELTAQITRAMEAQAERD